MNISKSKSFNKEASIAFDAIIEAIFEYKKLNLKDFNKDKVLLVSLGSEKNADFYFDYKTFCSGPVGQLIVIKSLSAKIFGAHIDPRKILNIINDKIKSKNNVTAFTKFNFKIS